MRIDWILPQKLAGSPRPGLLDPIEEDLELLERFGFDLVVNLTQTPLALPAPASFEIEHFPIPDMGVPTPRAMHRVATRVVRRIDSGSKVLVHCRAGLGRTGLFAACCLVCKGRQPEAAVIETRLVNHRFIQSPAQVQFVQHFADYVESVPVLPPAT